MKIIQVYNIDKKLNKQLNCIAKNNGETKTDFLRPKIKTFIESFPDELKIEKTDSEFTTLYITGISNKHKEQLDNISKNLNTTTSCLLRNELQRIADKTPEFLKSNLD